LTGLSRYIFHSFPSGRVSILQDILLLFPPANDRESPSIPANVKEIHSMPGSKQVNYLFIKIWNEYLWLHSRRQKLKITITRSAKITIELSICFVRNSARRFFVRSQGISFSLLHMFFINSLHWSKSLISVLAHFMRNMASG